ncbi:MAG: transglutaminase family protein [Pirellulaceae bacterium]|nr:transglutaminase family protein [Pirellulaceae bacterium]
MKYKITHTTTYIYESPVRVCHNLVMLTPRTDAHVRVHSHRLTILPHPQQLHPREDFFGNRFHAFSIEENHRQLKVTSISRVRVLYRKPPSAELTRPWEQVVAAIAGGPIGSAMPVYRDPAWLEATKFLYDSRRIQRSAAFADYALQDFTPGRPILLCAQALMQRIHKEFKYDTTATFVNTMPQEAMSIKRGVCQDFAQVAISCLRSIGLAARYVSGYLRTIPAEGKPRLVGADQSHAWFSLYCGAETGWIDLDPTNNCMCSNDHVPIAWGRDYQDVVPVRGVFLGGGQHTLKVSVDVLPFSSQQ